jgi:hypothetical protein
VKPHAGKLSIPLVVFAFGLTIIILAVGARLFFPSLPEGVPMNQREVPLSRTASDFHSLVSNASFEATVLSVYRREFTNLASSIGLASTNAIVITNFCRLELQQTSGVLHLFHGRNIDHSTFESLFELKPGETYVFPDVLLGLQTIRHGELKGNQASEGLEKHP